MLAKYVKHTSDNLRKDCPGVLYIYTFGMLKDPLTLSTFADSRHLPMSIWLNE